MKLATRVFLSELLTKDFPSFSKELIRILQGQDVSVSFLVGTNDVWCRDFMPVQVGDGFVQFSLTRDYYYKKDRHKITNSAPICKALDIDPIIPIYKSIPIFLDGGNVILSPSRTKAIITDKVFKDNRNIPRDDLANILQEVLRVEQIIFIPVETGDDTGHADGMVRFVDERTVVANDYSKVDVSQSFRDRFYGALKDSSLDVFLVPYHPVSVKTEGYWSAAGCYINFLKVGEKVFLPTFSDPVNDKAAIKRFGEVFGTANVIPVPSLEISRGGGVLNCLSWVINANFDV